MLNKVKPNGNMYQFITHTWNTIKGKCPHDCSYCYMKRWGKQPELHFDEKELKTDLGSGNYIFVGSSCDMWANRVPADYVCQTLNHCIAGQDHRHNKYLFQTKNPVGFKRWCFPHNSTYCITLESNNILPLICIAPDANSRVQAFSSFHNPNKMITIEPIMKFDLKPFVEMIKSCNPIRVNIGADSGNNNLPEPTKEEILQLIQELKKFTKVHIKHTLNRIIK